VWTGDTLESQCVAQGERTYPNAAHYEHAPHATYPFLLSFCRYKRLNAVPEAVPVAHYGRCHPQPGGTRKGSVGELPRATVPLAVASF
jgi:hypothetical protein